MYNKAMKETLCKISCAILLGLCMLVTGCASTGSGEDKNADEFEAPPLFLDWQYKGFGKEYPQWAEEALMQGSSETIEIHFGQNLDMLIPHEYEETESNIKAQTWVYIDPYYEEYEERYAYITLRQAQGPQGEEE